MPEKMYLNVPYDQKDLAKELGGFWDKDRKQWFAWPDSTLAAIYKWFPAKVEYQVREVEKVDYHDLNEDNTIMIAKMGLNQESFNKAADIVWFEGQQGDLSPDHRYHCIEREYRRIFPEISQQQYQELLSRWKP